MLIRPLGRHAVAMECAQLACSKRFADLASYDPLARYDDISGRRLRVAAIAGSRDLVSLFSSDLQPVRDAIPEMFREMAADVARSLRREASVAAAGR